MTNELDLTADVIDVRDIITRVEALENERDTCADPSLWADYCIVASVELADLAAILSDLRGNGGDEQWRGDWYPVTLVRDSYFKEYAQELAEDIGAIDRKASWPNNCIDWDFAASELQHDYTRAEIDGITYWYR